MKRILYHVAPLSSFPCCQAGEDWRGQSVLIYFKCWIRPLRLAEAESIGLSESGWHYFAMSHSAFWGAWKVSCLAKPVYWVGTLDFINLLI